VVCAAVSKRIGILELLQQLLSHLLGDIDVATPVDVPQITEILCLILLCRIILIGKVSEGAGVEALGDDILSFPGFGFQNQFGTRRFGNLNWAAQVLFGDLLYWL